MKELLTFLKHAFIFCFKLLLLFFVIIFDPKVIKAAARDKREKEFLYSKYAASNWKDMYHPNNPYNPYKK